MGPGFAFDLQEDLRPRAATGLLEREAELTKLNEAFRSANEGQGSIVLLQGPPGSGKSSLLAAARALAAEEGLEPLSAAGSEVEREFTFGVALQLFETRLDRADGAERGRLLAGAARLAAPLLAQGPRDVFPDGQAFSLFHGLYRLCVNLAEQRPLVLCVDDAQWADAPSLRFILYLAQRVEELPLTVVMTAQSPRNGSVDLLAQIAGHPAAKRLALSPLSTEAVARWVRALLSPDAHDAFCHACHQATAGNPLLLQKLVAELSSAGVEPRAEAATRVHDVGPNEVAAAIIRRLIEIEPAAVELARAAALLGDGAELRHAAQLAELEVMDAAPLADALIEADVLARAERLSFIHPIVRRALYADRPPADRAEAHLRAARMLAAEDAAVERAAWHLLPALRSGSPWVVDVLRSAAAAAMERGEPDAATRYLRRALEEPPESDRRSQVVLELGRAEARAGDSSGVERLSEAIERVDDPRRRARAALDLGRTLYAQGRPAEAAAAFGRGLEEARPVDEELAGRLRVAHAAVARLGLPGAAHGPAPPLPAPGDDGSPVTRLLCAEAAYAGARAGTPREEVVELAARSLGMGALLEEETSDGLGYYLAAAAFTAAEDLQTAEMALTGAVEQARSRGSALGFATASYFRAWAVLSRGRVDDAATDARNALAARRYGWRLAVPGAHAVVAEALIERGDLDGAARELETAGEGISDRDYGSLCTFLASRGHLRLLRRRPADALADFLECGRRLDHEGPVNPAVLAWRSGAAVASAALGRADEARRYAEEELDLASRFGAPGPVGRALNTLGMVTSGEYGIEALREAVDVLRDSQAMLLRARALVDYGSALRRSGRLRASRGPLREGLDLSESLGARALAGRAAEEVRAAGARPRRTALQGLDSLTPREHQVARLAARGMSNREIGESLFVTVKTVEWHLRNSYEKLGVSSRDELRDALAQTEKG